MAVLHRFYFTSKIQIRLSLPTDWSDSYISAWRTLIHCLLKKCPSMRILIRVFDGAHVNVYLLLGTVSFIIRKFEISASLVPIFVAKRLWKGRSFIQACAIVYRVCSLRPCGRLLRGGGGGALGCRVCCGFLCFVTFQNVSCSISELRLRLALWNWLKPSGKIFYWPFHGGTSLVLCLVFVMLSRLFSAALWSPAVNGLTSWLLFVMFYCIFTLNKNVSLAKRAG